MSLASDSSKRDHQATLIPDHDESVVEEVRLNQLSKGLAF